MKYIVYSNVGVFETKQEAEEYAKLYFNENETIIIQK